MLFVDILLMRNVFVKVLHSPFALFGLGRSPNFVDEVFLGSPRWRGSSSSSAAGTI
jgi:hypothetical protein